MGSVQAHYISCMYQAQAGRLWTMHAQGKLMCLSPPPRLKQHAHAQGPACLGPINTSTNSGRLRNATMARVPGNLLCAQF
jgi:hypothetical protein